MTHSSDRSTTVRHFARSDANGGKTVTVMAAGPTNAQTHARAEVDADYTPRYIQVARLVRERIKDGTYPKFSLVPGSKKLAAEFRVSPEVALHGLGVLVRDRK